MHQHWSNNKELMMSSMKLFDTCIFFWNNCINFVSDEKGTRCVILYPTRTNRKIDESTNSHLITLRFTHHRLIPSSQDFSPTQKPRFSTKGHWRLCKPHPNNRNHGKRNNLIGQEWKEWWRRELEEAQGVPMVRVWMSDLAATEVPSCFRSPMYTCFYIDDVCCAGCVN